MKTYTIYADEITNFEFNVEADTKNEALAIAVNRLLDMSQNEWLSYRKEAPYRTFSDRNDSFISELTA